MPAIELIFWIFFGLVFYTYGLYPLILLLLPKRSVQTKTSINERDLPLVSVVISVYNEEKVLSEKLKNILTTQYPKEKIEFIFGSDGSTDRTSEILLASGPKNVKCEIYPIRSGKANILNKLIKSAKGEIIIFSDANTMYNPDTIRKLVEPFTDVSVGGVCGELRLVINKKSVGEIGEKSYWQYESFLKNLESNFQTLLGATGGVYAIRKSLFKPLPMDMAIVDDFLIPLEVVRLGFRMIYQPEAVAYEESAGTVIGEFKRKVRIGASNINGIPLFLDLLNPKKGFVAFALWSHKIIRWFVPFLLACIFMSSLILMPESNLYSLLVYVQLIFLFMGLIGFYLEERKIGLGIFGFPYYFIAMNLSLFVGFLKSITGHQKPTWNVDR